MASLGHTLSLDQYDNKDAGDENDTFKSIFLNENKISVEYSCLFHDRSAML